LAGVGPGRDVAPAPRGRREAAEMRSPTPPPFRAESPSVGDEQGSTTRSSPLLCVDTPAGEPEAYALFRPGELLSGERSAQLRRLEEDMVSLRLDDVYGALAMRWQVDRRDINDSHGNEWDVDLYPDFWVSTDTGKLCFVLVPDTGHALSEPGQYHKEVGGAWVRFADAMEAPGNCGGSHSCCIGIVGDASGAASEWTLVAKLADFGQVLGRDAGLRTEFAALVRNDCEALIASVGPHDECRSLFCVDVITLPAGQVGHRVVLADPAELTGVGGEGSADGPTAPSGMGAGYYPVFVSRDECGEVCRITACFHSERAWRVCRRFPPVVGGSQNKAAREPPFRPPDRQGVAAEQESEGEPLR